jgi:hypothetical protein
MLSLAAEHAGDLPRILQCRGGFAWWYADLVDDRGNGVVLIWAFGLPFLPGARRAAPAGSRPCVSLAVYEAHRPSFYLLQTYPAGAAQLQEPGLLRLGASSFRLQRDARAARLEVALDLPLPSGDRLTGSMHAYGAPCRVEAESGAAHRWSPILAATAGEAQLCFGGGDAFALAGRAYADSNSSSQPLQELGIGDWCWGRVALPGRELIYYLVYPAQPGAAPVALLLEALPDGTLVRHAVEARWSGPRRSIYGLRWHEQLSLASAAAGLELELRFVALVDDGPFYLRFLVDAHGARLGRGVGVAERVAVRQVDRAWQRPFVRMRTHATHGANSIWLPLFSGPVRGRGRRMLQHWLVGAREQGAAGPDQGVRS